MSSAVHVNFKTRSLIHFSSVAFLSHGHFSS